MNIIPAIDLIDGKCVRLKQGNYAEKKVYSDSPVEMAKSFADAGLQALHLVDLDGAKGGAPQNLSVLSEIAAATSLTIDYSGGIRTESDVEAALSSGASFIAVGSAAVKSAEVVQGWLESFGVEKFILGADVRGRNLAISGWTEDTEIAITDYVSSWSERGVKRFLCTAIQQDGLLQGPDFELYAELRGKFPGKDFIVSGGISDVSELERLRSEDVQSVIVGKAIYEGRISLEQLRKFSC